MKTIVAHIAPDLDAIASSWLIKRHMPGWADAEHAFVPAGKTLNNKPPDEDPDIIHVDTGLGRFDHHQLSERSSATRRVFDFLIHENHIKERDREALEHMVVFITDIDNFGEVYFPDPTNIRYMFCLHEFIYPLRGTLSSDTELTNVIMLILDSILYTVKNALKAEAEIKAGLIMTTSLGKTLVMENKNESSVKFALKKGFDVVVRRDPDSRTIRIKTQPTPAFDLTTLADTIKKADPHATWFLHASKNMLLNGSSKNPDSIPSALTLTSLIAILKEM